jgi:hypothetical protein
LAEAETLHELCPPSDDTYFEAVWRHELNPIDFNEFSEYLKYVSLMDELLSVKSGEICPGGIELVIFRDSTQIDSSRFQDHVQDNKWPINL